MNGNYQSFNTYQGPAEQASPASWNAVRVHDAINRVTSTDGIVTEEAAPANDRGNAGQLNPFHGTDSIFATARNANGSPLMEITGETLVTIAGVQAPVQFFVAEGVLQKNSDGSFGPAAVKAQAAPAADTSGNVQPLDPAAMGTVNQALAEVDQGSLDSLMASATGTAIGKMDAASLAQRFSSASGLSVEESHARVATIRGAFQGQADAALKASGIGAADLPEFWEWARVNHRGELQQAVQLQLRTHAVAGYRDLASRWQSATPPSLNALKEAGIPVRKQGTGSEVFLRGSWMTLGAASKSGFI